MDEVPLSSLREKEVMDPFWESELRMRWRMDLPQNPVKGREAFVYTEEFGKVL